GPEAIEAFQEQLHEFKTSKGTIQFPLDKEIPDEIIEAIVHFNLERFKDKSSPDWKRYNQQWKEAAEIVEQIINELPLTKEFKWGGDIYTYQGKNVVGYGGFKNHFGQRKFINNLLNNFSSFFPLLSRLLMNFR